MKFNEWLIKEETKEERARRELEAKRREDLFMKHKDQEEENKSIERASGFSKMPTTDDELKDYMDLRRKLPNTTSPSEEFVEKVYDNVDKRTKFHLYDFPDNPKGDADSQRILKLIHDCFDDGTSEEEATNMIIDLLRKMNYIN